MLALLGSLLTAGPPAHADEEAGPPIVIGSISVVDPSQAAMVTTTTRTGRVDAELSDSTYLWVQWDDEPQTAIEIRANTEHVLHSGYFPDVGGSSTSSPVTLEAFSFGHGRSTDHGFVDIRDIAFDESGAIIRFDIAFATSSRNVPSSAFGTMRMNEPEPSSRFSPTARSFSWPLRALSADPVPAVERISNTTTSPQEVGDVHLKGAARDDYRIRHDHCSGRTLAAGASCTLAVTFNPRSGGPRTAILVVPTAGPNLAVGLSGTGMIGTTRLTLAGRYPAGNPTTLPHVIAQGADTVDRSPGRYTFNAFDSSSDVELTLDGGHPLATGRHDTGGDAHHDMTGRILFDLLAAYRCNDMYGHETVSSFAVDEDNQPTSVDLTFSQHCVTFDHPARDFTGRLRWQDRRDRTGPTRPSSLEMDNGDVQWRNSRSSDWSHTIVRAFPAGSKPSPLGGYAIYSGRGHRAELTSLPAGQRYSIAAFSVDRTGNVSQERSVTITA